MTAIQSLWEAWMTFIHLTFYTILCEGQILGPDTPLWLQSMPSSTIERMIRNKGGNRPRNIEYGTGNKANGKKYRKGSIDYKFHSICSLIAIDYTLYSPIFLRLMKNADTFEMSIYVYEYVYTYKNIYYKTHATDFVAVIIIVKPL